LLDGCSISDQYAAQRTVEHSARWWIVGSGASNVVVVNSSLRSATPGTGLLQLIGKSEALFRNCDGSNVVINDLVGADARLGIVDSTFEPSVYPTFALRPPKDKCGVPMAGLPPICDPRAQCIAKASGIGCS
jgi:hypothetical protein